MRAQRTIVISLLALAACATPRFAELTEVDATPRILIATPITTEFDAHVSRLSAPETITLQGVDFVTGDLAGSPVVVFKTGVSPVNAAMNTQLALDRFSVSEIVVSGVAGGLDPELSIGDIAVPERWGKYDEFLFLRETEDGVAENAPWGAPLPYSPFGFMAPRGVRPSGATTGTPYQFWFEADPELLAAARRAAETIELQQCGTNGACLYNAPKARVGGSGVTGSIFLDNAAFRTYLHQTFEAQAADMETAAIAVVAHAHGTPFIGFRSLSDLAGGGAGPNQFPAFAATASDNVATFVEGYVAERTARNGRDRKRRSASFHPGAADRILWRGRDRTGEAL